MHSSNREGAMRGALIRVVAGVAVLGGVLASCQAVRAEDETLQQGRELITEYGCGTCHAIPGVRGANGLVGPPLTKYHWRVWVAGQHDMPNTIDNTTRWIVEPQRHDPSTDMPDLGVSEEHAHKIAQYLDSLR